MSTVTENDRLPFPPPCRRASSRRNAFSLVELLVVAALLCVLAVLGVSVSGRVIERSRSARCAANLRSLYNAHMAYASDHQGVVPLDYIQDENGVWKYVSFTGLKDYLPIPSHGTGYYEPYLCPSDRAPYFGFSYGTNGYLAREDALTKIKLNRVSAWERRSETFLLADSPRTLIYANASASFAYRHDEGVNLVFLDGHVECRRAPFTNPANAKNERLWNPRL